MIANELFSTWILRESLPLRRHTTDDRYGVPGIKDEEGRYIVHVS